MTEQCFELAATADSIATARVIVLDVVAELPQLLRDDAALLVSELMSNAVRHGGAIALLTVSLHDGLVVVAVHDDGSGLPVMRQGAEDRTLASGRGLRIVQRLADAWGVDVDSDGTGKTVWFRLTVASATRGHQEREDEKV